MSRKGKMIAQFKEIEFYRPQWPTEKRNICMFNVRRKNINIFQSKKHPNPALISIVVVITIQHDECQCFLLSSSHFVTFNWRYKRHWAWIFHNFALTHSFRRVSKYKKKSQRSSMQHNSIIFFTSVLVWDGISFLM